MRCYDYEQSCKNGEANDHEARGKLAPTCSCGRGLVVRYGQRCSRRLRPGVVERDLISGSRSVSESSLPYGVQDLDSKVVMHSDDPDQVQCFVRGCSHFVRRPTRHQSGTPCPTHGIYCHHSKNGSTYRYVDVTRNIIASPDMFAKWVVGHPFKYESDRFGAENSEDALSWNVFRSLQEAGKLAEVARFFTGMEHTEQPRLYLWGLRVDDDSYEPWDLLIAARERFESRLPVKRPKTEPDIALHLPGRYLVLIEAKFTSPNSTYKRGPRKDSQSLTLDELLDIYQDPKLRILDQTKARSVEAIHYQFWRNTVFAEWMALQESAHTVAGHVSLVRQAGVTEDAQVFSDLLADGCSSHFRQATWEGIAAGVAQDLPRLKKYLVQKTCYLGKAFNYG